MLVLALGIGGCTALPGDGPWMGGAQSTSTEALPFDVIDLTPTTVAAYRLASVDRPSTATADLSPAVPISIAPGDVLRVRIFEKYGGNIFPTLQGEKTDLGVQRVAPDGTIDLPYVGKVQVSGLDLPGVEERIKQQLGNKVQDPEVIADFDAPRAHTVIVSGDVKKPGRVSLLEGVRTAVDAFNQAGGSLLPANQLEIVVRRHGQVILTSQLSDMLAGNDIPVERNDEIVVRPNTRVYTVLGAVQKSGNVEMTKANLSLLEALGNVGGLMDQRANKTGVYVFRMGDLLTNPTARARVFRLDLFQPVSIFVAQQFGVQARDVVYVTNAPLYEYDKVLTSIYRTFSIIGVARGNILTSTSF
ncbi:MAG: polysaccharide biosynthesis/export family protein [Alphaproteobacteria bacterium]|nr:polysaccharide biosynthesis/export family protein [Alphaproteobacteria bacterium]MBV8406148.1 polysaccharide biosynthesis/export family protein [Alphaproteobacteria bacterium]